MNQKKSKVDSVFRVCSELDLLRTVEGESGI